MIGAADDPMLAHYPGSLFVPENVPVLHFAAALAHWIEALIAAQWYLRPKARRDVRVLGLFANQLVECSDPFGRLRREPALVEFRVNLAGCIVESKFQHRDVRSVRHEILTQLEFIDERLCVG